MTLDDVLLTPLTVHADDRGWLMELLRQDDYPTFLGFGQAYVTAIYPGAVKAWHRHQKQTDQQVCLVGSVKLVVGVQYLSRTGGPQEWEFREVSMIAQAPVRVTIPPDIWHGVMNVGPETALMVNMPVRVYDAGNPDEERLPAHGTVPYGWARQDK